MWFFTSDDDLDLTCGIVSRRITGNVGHRSFPSREVSLGVGSPDAEIPSRIVGKHGLVPGRGCSRIPLGVDLHGGNAAVYHGGFRICVVNCQLSMNNGDSSHLECIRISLMTRVPSEI